MLFYTADHDENKTNPDGSHQYVHNLCEEGFESWNKWYSGPPNEAARFDGEKVTITVRINPAQTISTYSLISAGDNLRRAPRRWELWGQRKGSDISQWEQLHVVSNARFIEYFERKDFVIDEDMIDVAFCALQLRISGSQKRGDGIQLNQLSFELGKLRGRGRDAVLDESSSPEHCFTVIPTSTFSRKIDAKTVLGEF